MTDIVDELRGAKNHLLGYMLTPERELMEKAATEIETLRAQIGDDERRLLEAATEIATSRAEVEKYKRLADEIQRSGRGPLEAL